MKRFTSQAICAFSAIIFLLANSTNVCAQIINTVVGGGLQNPGSVAFDKNGNMYIADYFGGYIRKVSTSGVISIIAGNGEPGYNGDNGPATEAQLFEPTGVAIDTAGNLYIADYGNYVVRKVDATGIITTFAGDYNATVYPSGDNGPATAAGFYSPYGVTVDSIGNVYITDNGAHNVRKVNTSGIITTIAGSAIGTSGYNGDNGLATDALLNASENTAFDALGNMYIADYGNNRIRKVDAVSGIITTIAGTGTAGYNGDGITATTAQLNTPADIAFDATGNVYIADEGNNRIRKINIASGIISTVAGTGTAGYIGGDNGQATMAALNAPDGIAFNASGNLYIADFGNNCIREVNTASGIITTAANTATNTTINFGVYGGSIAFDNSGNMYISNADNIAADNIIRKVDAISGAVNIVCGTGAPGYNGDNITAAIAQLDIPADIVFDTANNMYIADRGNNRIRKVDAISGIITTIAGNGIGGYNGDGITATTAELDSPSSIAFDASGNMYISDYNNNRIREVNTVGIINTIAGTGTAGYTGDNGPATTAQIEDAWHISVDKTGSLYMVDRNGNYVRKINTAGIIGTIAGVGTYGYGGDGGPAAIGILFQPTDVKADANGNVYIADAGNQRIRQIDTSGIITTVAGSGSSNFSGDGSLATAAGLNFPCAVALDSSQNIYVVDKLNERVREILMPCSSVTAGTITNTGNDTFCISGSTVLNLVGATAGAHNFFATNISEPTGIAYQWQYSTDGTVWNNVSTDVNADTTVYATGNITATTYYRVVVTCTTSGLADTTAVDTITVNSALIPTVSIAANTGNTICPGTNVTFTATPINGGTTPAYQWIRNSAVITSTNEATYTTSDLNNNDTIVCILTSSAGCVTAATATSDTIVMNVTAAVTPSVNITANPGDTLCAGIPVTFTANASGGGNAPTFQWTKNGAIVAGETNAIYVNNNANNNDAIACVITSSATCASPDTANSDTLVLTVNPIIIPTVSIAANPGDTLCAGTSVVFTAITTGGGIMPTYEWTINGDSASNGTTYTTDSLNNSDAVVCTLVSTATCAEPDTVSSNILAMTVDPVIIPAVNISATSTNINAGQVVVFTATTTFGGTNTTYQWQANEVNIAGATNSTYVTDTLENDNMISCIIHSNATCAVPDTAISNILTVQVSSAVASINNAGGVITLYPNPNNGTFTVAGTISGGNKAQIEVLDIVGQTVYKERVLVQNGQLSKQIRLSDNNANGIYLLRIKTDSGSGMIWFVTER